VQQRASRAERASEVPTRAVGRVADDGMAERGQVHADLVGPPGLQLGEEPAQQGALLDGAGELPEGTPGFYGKRVEALQALVGLGAVLLLLAFWMFPQ
jgi:hypothetical protein